MNRFLQFTNKTASLIILNILFILTSVPVITAGLSLSALLDTAIHLRQNTESYLWRSYFSVWKSSVRPGGPAGLVVVLAFVLSIADLLIIPRMPVGTAKIFLLCFQLVFLFLLCGFSLYYFSLSSYFGIDAERALKNSILLAFKYLPHTFVCVLLSALPVILALLFPRIIVVIISLMAVIGFSGIAYLQVYILSDVFRKETLLPEK